MSDISLKVFEIVEEHLGLDFEVTPEDILLDLSDDELDFVELLMAFEEEFEIEIPDEDAEDFVTVGDIIEYIEDQL